MVDTRSDGMEIENGCRALEESVLPELKQPCASPPAEQSFVSNGTVPTSAARIVSFTGVDPRADPAISLTRRTQSFPVTGNINRRRSGEGSFFHAGKDDESDAGPEGIQGTIGFAAAAPDLVGDRPESAPFSLRGWFPHDENAWLKLTIIAFFVIVDSATSLIDAWALDGADPAQAQGALVAQSAVSLLAGFLLSVGLEGVAGLRSVFEPWEILRWLPVSIGFATASYSLALSYTLGIGASQSQALGMLYMPLTAILSRRLFNRHYGWLEVHALGLLAFCAATFIGVIRSKNDEPVSFNGHWRQAIILSLISSVVSAFSAVGAERLLKAKYHPTGDGCHFFVQKFRLEIGGFVTTLVILFTVTGSDVTPGFIGWNRKLSCSLIIRVVQSWYGGMIAKHVSSLARAVAACVKLVVVYGVQTAFLDDADLSFCALDLAGILSGSALLYVVGRNATRLEERASMSLSPITVRGEDPLVPAHVRQAEFTVQEEDEEGQESDCMACLKKLAELGIVFLFIMADASRTMAFAWAINNAPIVSQSVVFMRSASSVVIGLAVSIGIHDCDGAKQVFDFWRVLLFFPISFCFSAGATLTAHAYACGISPTANTVLGYSYMPLSAVLSRWVFKRAYSGLEWLSLTIITFSAVAFMLTDDTTSSSDSNKLTAEAVLSCFGSVFLSALGAIFAEKLLKGQGSQPFYIQNTHLEIGGTVTAFIFMFVMGFVSNRAKDGFWKPREVHGRMESGWFVGWEPKTVWALLATICQSWLGGLVSKRLNTVVRAVAQCMSLLVIYFLGDIIIQGKPLQWIRGCASIIVVLSVLIFSQAGTKGKKKV